LLASSIRAFAHEWMKESRNGLKRFRSITTKTKEHQLESASAPELRGMHALAAADGLVDKARTNIVEGNNFNVQIVTM